MVALRPDPSLKPTRPRYDVAHHPSRGPCVPPSRAAQLDRSAADGKAMSGNQRAPAYWPVPEGNRRTARAAGWRR